MDRVEKKPIFTILRQLTTISYSRLTTSVLVCQVSSKSSPPRTFWVIWHTSDTHTDQKRTLFPATKMSLIVKSSRHVAATVDVAVWLPWLFIATRRGARIADIWWWVTTSSSAGILLYTIPCWDIALSRCWRLMRRFHACRKTLNRDCIEMKFWR